jgi:hypothetical protein
LGAFADEIELHKSGRAVIFVPLLTSKGFQTLIYDTKKHRIIKRIFTKDVISLSGNLKNGIFASGYRSKGLNKGQLYIFNPKLLRLQPVIKHNNPRTPPFFMQRYKNLLIGTNSGYNRLSIIDIKKKRIVKTFKAEPKPNRTAIFGTKLYIAHYYEPGSEIGNKITVFDIKKMKFTGEELLIDEPSDICICNNKLYVINGKENRVQIYNPNDLTLKKSIQFSAIWIDRLSAYDENDGPMSRRLLSN